MNRTNNNFIDLTGNRFGRLTVLTRVENSIPKSGKRSRIRWLCLCDCGNKKIVTGDCLKLGHTTSCGCIRYKDYTGKKFGRWTLLEFVERKNNRTLWRCQCDCGTIRNVALQDMQNGVSMSCGCLRSEITIERNKNTKRLQNRKGIITVYNIIYRQYKSAAKNKNIIFNLSLNQLIEIISQPCVYCGKNDIRKNHYTGEEFSLNGIDRINSNEGYYIGNVQPCCSICNYAKRTMPEVEFISWIISVYNHYINKETNECH